MSHLWAPFLPQDIPAAHPSIFRPECKVLGSQEAKSAWTEELNPVSSEQIFPKRHMCVWLGVCVCVCRRAANGTKIAQALAPNDRFSSRKGGGGRKEQGDGVEERGGGRGKDKETSQHTAAMFETYLDLNSRKKVEKKKVWDNQGNLNTD